MLREKQQAKIREHYASLSQEEKAKEQARLAHKIPMIMPQYLSLYEKYGEICPGCGAPMLRPHPLDKNGYKRSGACFNCGYTERPVHHSNNLSEQASKNNIWGYLRKYSIGIQGKMSDKTFSNYDDDTPETKDAKNKAILIAKRLSNGSPIHSAIIGPTGVGKTHLALSIINYAEQLCHYHLHVMFLSVPLFNEARYDAMHDNVESAQLVARIKYEIARADLVVLDDLGAERDTEYSKQLIDMIAIEREDKALLFTSNLKSDDGQDALARYSGRTKSRLKAHMKHNFIVFNNTQDYRVKN